MNKILQRQAIWQHRVPLSTLHEVDEDFERGRQKFGLLFKNDEEFRIFWGLPLSDKQRLQLLRVLGEEKRFQEELDSCPGDPDTTAEHRARCIDCCVARRPVIAAPYHE